MTDTATAAPRADLSPAARLRRVEDLAYPTRRDEAWRYAPHKALERLAFGTPAGASGGLSADGPSAGLEQQIPTLEGPRIVLVNGVVDAAHSRLTDLPAGLHLTTLADVLAHNPDRVAAHFHDRLDGAAHAFSALNIAYGSDGAVISVDDRCQIDVPIHVVDVAITGGVAERADSASCAGVVIDLGQGASATVVETRLGAGAEFGGSNVRTTITLGAEAILDHIVLQDVPTAQIHLARIDVTQGAASVLRAHSFNLGAAFGRIDYDVHLAGEGATAELSGLYFGRGDQVLDQQVRVVHGAKDCISRQSFRGVLDDESTGVFNGGIDVRPGADGTDAEQLNANLLLSTGAEINTQPRLEILADDVACKHGATVGQLDEEALYYLRSRGIPAEEARRLLIKGFADQAVDELGIEVLQTWITDRLGHHDE